MGTPYTSDYVFSEAVTLAYRRTKRSDFAVEVGRFILGELPRPLVVMVRVSEGTYSDAWAPFENHSRRGLSFTDCTSLALMRERMIESMGSYDGSFEGLVAVVR